ncbi:MAG TPA: hypothetical protein VGJ21_15280 [Terracidiphilus sp.]|jgi:hypothetical protein
MQAAYANQRFEIRLLIMGMLWLFAGFLAYMLARMPGALWFLPREVGYRLAPIPLQQIADTFPMFAAIIAMSLLCVWWFSCGKWGAANISAAWMFLEIGYQFAQRHDVASWIIPSLPYFFHTTWPFYYVERAMGSGDFNENAIVGAILGGVFAYMMAVNSIPRRLWTLEQLRAR